jgi:tyrosine-specific transport protein
MNVKLIGAILLIINTTIGVGIMAFPAMCTSFGIVYANVVLIVAWFIFVYSGLLMVEINLWLPEQSHLVSMAKISFGTYGKIITWIFYVLMFYAIIVIYFSALDSLTTDLINDYFGIVIAPGIMLIVYSLIFGFISHVSIRFLSKINLWLFLGFISAFAAVMVGTLPISSLSNLALSYHAPTHYSFIVIAFAIMGYQFIIPLLRDFLGGDPQQLRAVIIWGGVITLVFYLTFEFVMLTAMSPRELAVIAEISNPTAAIATDFSFKTQHSWFDVAFRWFAYFAVVTSLLSVSYSVLKLFDDGFRVQKWQVNRITSLALIYVPSMIYAYFLPQMFLVGLKYSGLINIVLFLIIPILMVWQGRYKKNLSFGYQVKGGKPMLLILLVLAVLLLIFGLGFSQ